MTSLPPPLPFPAATRADWRAHAAVPPDTSPPEGRGVAGSRTRIEPIYHRDDLVSRPLRDGLPGQAPFHRGFAASGWGAAGWGVATAISVDTAAELAVRLREEVEGGATAIRLRLGQVRSRSEVADTEYRHRWGTPLHSASDITKALSHVLLPYVTLILDGGAATPAFLAAFRAALGEGSPDGEAPLMQLDLHSVWDPLVGMIASEHHQPVIRIDEQYALLHNLLTHHITPCSPRVFSLDAAAIAEAGGGPIHQLVWLGGAMIEYVRRLVQGDITAERVIRGASAQLAASPDFFVTIATFRAARVVLGTILREFGLDPAVVRFPLHAIALSRGTSLLDPHTNILRVTADVFGAAMGGAATITALPFDSALPGVTCPRAQRLARNTQLILRDEAQLGPSIDPAGGSWCIESLTEEFATEAWEHIQAIESMGGMYHAICVGYLQNLVQDAAQKRAQAVVTRRQIMVGVNQFTQPDEVVRWIDKTGGPVDLATAASSSSPPQSTLHPDRCQLESLEGWRSFDTWVARARLGHTIGDIIDAWQQSVLRSAESANSPASPAPRLLPAARRDAVPFEELRYRTALMSEKTGMGVPRAVIGTIGDAAALRARIDFCRDLLGVAGCSVLTPPPVSVVEQFGVGDAWLFAEGHEPDVVVICAADEAYERVISSVITKVGEQYSCPCPLLLVAGQLGEREDAIRAAGVFAFMHRRSNPIIFLTSLIDAISAARTERTSRYVPRPPFPTENAR